MCDACGSTSSLKRCACLVVLYCGACCQAGAWLTHKAACKEARAAAASRAATTRAPASHAAREVTDAPGLPNAEDAMVRVMRKYLANASMMERMLRTVLSRTILSSDNVAFMTRAGTAGFVEAMVAALRTHPANATLQTLGCSVLTRMVCEIAANVMRVANAGVVEAAVAAMLAHATDVDVQERACIMIGVLSLTSAESVR